MTETTNQIAQVTNNGNYEITKTADGKFTRKTVYKPFSSVEAVTREQKMNLMKLLDSDSKVAQPLNDHIGAQFQIADVILMPYDSLDEATGELEYGCLSYLITPEGVAYVTSSKSVYHTLRKWFVAFGEPHWADEEVITVQAVKKPGKQFKFTDLNIVG